MRAAFSQQAHFTLTAAQPMTLKYGGALTLGALEQVCSKLHFVESSCDVRRIQVSMAYLSSVCARTTSKW